MLQVRNVTVHWKMYICIILMCIVIFRLMFTTKTAVMKTGNLREYRTHQLQFRPPATKSAIIKMTTELMPSNYSSLYLALKTEVKRKLQLNMHIKEEVRQNIKPTTIETTTRSVHMKNNTYTTTRSNIKTFNIKLV